MKLGGCAAISSTMPVSSHTRPYSSWQAALEHLESIIVYPPGMEPKENGAKMNGHEGDGDSLGSES